MAKDKFTLTRPDPKLQELIDITDKKTLAIWAKKCAERVIHYYTDNFRMITGRKKHWMFCRNGLIRVSLAWR